MKNRFLVSVLAAAAIYMVLAGIFGAGIKTIATQVPADQTDPEFAPVVCSLAVACSHPGHVPSTGSMDGDRLQTVAETK